MIDKIFEIGIKEVFSSTPAEYVTIKEALEGKLNIRLNNGFYHEIKEDQLKSLSEKIPIYLWSLVKIPFVLIKSTEVGEFFVNGDEWNKKAISILLQRDVRGVISSVDVEKLLREYSSLIFIILSPTIYMESELNEM